MKVDSRICDQCGTVLDKNTTVNFQVRDESDYDEGGISRLEVELCPKCAGERLHEFFKKSMREDCDIYCRDIRQNWRKLGWSG